MDCQDARLLQAFAHPGAEQLDATEQEALRQHLATCPECAAQALSEVEFDRAVGAALRDVPMPAGLKERLLTQVARRPRPLPIAWLAATAAGLLVAAGLTGTWYVHHWPELTSTEIVALQHSRPHDPEGVQSWFAERGVTMDPPREFDYQYLVGCDVVEFRGQRVPKLLFFCDRGEHARDPVTMQVYVLSRGQFRLDEQLPERPIPGTQAVSFSQEGDGPGYVYVRVHNVPDLRPPLVVMAH